jgi:hypothetical protein
MRVFVSYSHRQGEWVRDALVPVLRAGGAEVLVDWERLRPGYAVVGEMNGTQDTADRHVLIITADYLASKYCLHEMNRAIKLDPGFPSGKVLPVKLDDSALPKRMEPLLYVDLRDTGADDKWQLLIRQCGGDLRMAAPAWVAALDQTKKHLDRNESVNVVVRGDVDWRAWLEQLRHTRFLKLPEVDLENPHGSCSGC